MLLTWIYFYITVFRLTTGNKVPFWNPMPENVRSSLQVDASKPTLTLTTVTQYGGMLVYQGAICTQGIQLALDGARNSSILSDYNVAMNMNDEKCDLGIGVNMTTRLLNAPDEIGENVVPLIIGPSCISNTYTGMLMQHYNFVGVTDSSGDYNHFVNRQMYNSFFVLAPSFEAWFQAIPKFLKANGWNRVVLLTDSWIWWRHLEDVMFDEFARLNITLAGTAKLVVLNGFQLPSTEQFEGVAREIADFDPRVIIFNSPYSAILSCWLYRYKLYGPNYVYLLYSMAYFQPNAFTGVDGCTEKMLFEFQASLIYYSWGSPVQLKPDYPDVFGVTGRRYDQFLKDTIEKPETYAQTWFNYRSLCYSQTVAVLIALDEADKKLKKQGDSLVNWVTSSAKFRTNGTYIRDLLKATFNSLKVRLLLTNPNENVNTRTGLTAFFQMQLDQKTGRYEPVPVATYDSSPMSPNNSIVINGPNRFIWKTWNGRPPTDSVRVYWVTAPIFSPAANGVIKALACAFVLVNLLLLFAKFQQRTKQSTLLACIGGAKSIGQLTMLIGILVLPVEGDMQNPNWNCMASGLLVIFGFSLLTSAVLGELYIASACTTLETANQTASRARLPSAARQIENSRNTSRPQLADNTQKQIIVIDIDKINAKARWVCAFVALWTTLQTLITVIWFGLAPIEVDKFFGRLEIVDVSLHYQPVTMACQVRSNSTGFLVALVVCYVLIFLRSLAYNFTLRQLTVTTVGELSDIHLIRLAGYSMGLFAFVGGGITMTFYSANPAQLQIAVASIILAINCIGSLLMAIPAIKTMKQPI